MLEQPGESSGDQLSADDADRPEEEKELLALGPGDGVSGRASGPGGGLASRRCQRCCDHDFRCLANQSGATWICGTTVQRAGAGGGGRRGGG